MLQGRRADPGGRKRWPRGGRGFENPKVIQKKDPARESGSGPCVAAMRNVEAVVPDRSGAGAPFSSQR